MSTLEIIVDTREYIKANKIVKFLKSKEINVKVETLSVGDYFIPSRRGANVLVERKQALALINDIKTRRIWAQARKLVQSDSYSLMIVEGLRSQLLKYTKFSKTALVAAITVLNIKFNIPVYIVSNYTWTRLFLYSLVRILQGERSTNILRPKKREKPTISDEELQALFFLQGLPGCGPKTAAKLLYRFGSVKRIVNASLEELEVVEGVGKKRAKHWHKIFNYTIWKEGSV